MTALVIRGDARELPLPDGCVDLIVTSPPYFALRSYTDGGAHYQGQIGSEATPAAYIDALIECTREMVRVLKPSGSIWVDLGDKYSTGNSGDRHSRGRDVGASGGPVHSVRSESVANMQPKSLMLLPERYRIAAVDRLGLIARAVVIWSKPNGLPESVTDRVRRSHEDWVHLVKLPRYFAAVDEIREPHLPVSLRRAMPHRANVMAHEDRHEVDMTQACHPLGKLPGSVWDIATQPLTVPKELKVDHFAAFPMEWPRRIIAGWSPSGICTVCGEGRRPVVDKRYLSETVHGADYKTPDTWRGDRSNPRERADDGTFLPRPDYVDTALLRGRGPTVTRLGDGALITLTGYACACPEPTASTRPAVVLDPFGGTGTTALVASVLGRIGISVDRSADYCRLARWRTTNQGEIARAMRVDKPVPVADAQLSLDWEVTS